MSQSGTLNTTSSSPEIPTSFVTDSGTAVPVANVLNVVGGVGITTTGSGNTISISVTSAMPTWVVVTSSDNPVSLVVNRGYIAKGAGVVNFTLPAAASIGDRIQIEGYGNLWTLAQNAGQKIILNNQTTTIGAAGSLSATMISDNLELICVTANTEFKAVDIGGNLTIV
jgi:hypothetical protein